MPQYKPHTSTRTPTATTTPPSARTSSVRGQRSILHSQADNAGTLHRGIICTTFAVEVQLPSHVDARSCRYTLSAHLSLLPADQSMATPRASRKPCNPDVTRPVLQRNKTNVPTTILYTKTTKGRMVPHFVGNPYTTATQKTQGTGTPTSGRFRCTDSVPTKETMGDQPPGSVTIVNCP